MVKFKLRWLVSFILLGACIERIEFDVPDPQSLLVVEGMISDEPGPYFVKISNALALDGDTVNLKPISRAGVKLFESSGDQEDLIEVKPGVYATKGAIRGKVGYSYYIRIITPDGNMFESMPDKIYSPGTLENIRFEFEKRTIVESFGETGADAFNIRIDSKANDDNSESYLRWRFKGIYKAVTNPELNLTIVPPYKPLKDPYPCSGYIVVSSPEGIGGLLEKVAECTCCECWASQFEDFPQLSDTQLVNDNEFRDIKVGEVPINGATFHEKYMVEIEQMGLSRNAFEFFKQIRDQKIGASSLFQPPLGEVKGNIKPLNNTASVVGIFWATSSTKKSIFIKREDVPYPVVPIQFNTKPCYRTYPNSTTTKPTNW